MVLRRRIQSLQVGRPYYQRMGSTLQRGEYLFSVPPFPFLRANPQTTQALIKETLSSRKNTSPQNVYETAQLYAAGALKVACVGLQCVGFNGDMYKGVLELAAKGVGANPVGSGVASGPGKWKGVSGSEGLGLGLGTAGTAWNSTSNASMGDITGGVGGLSLGPGIIGRIADGIENNAPGAG